MESDKPKVKYLPINLNIVQTRSGGSAKKNPTPKEKPKFRPVKIICSNKKQSSAKGKKSVRNTLNVRQSSTKKATKKIGKVEKKVQPKRASTSSLKIQAKKHRTDPQIKKKLFKSPMPSSSTPNERKNKKVLSCLEFKPLPESFEEKVNELEISNLSEEFVKLENELGVNTPSKLLRNEIMIAVGRMDNVIKKNQNIVAEAQNVIEETQDVRKSLVSILEKLNVPTQSTKKDLRKTVLNKNLASSTKGEPRSISKFEEFYNFTPKPSRQITATPKSMRGKLLHKLAEQETLLK